MKELRNRSTFVEVMDKSRVSCFLTRGVWYAAVMQSISETDAAATLVE